mmetsp:Transcript_319/g.971  ORF Transcript_319/g.971 Transcript_319/m.971 type:complete len:93 (-) Transcript_319:3131-3409(-)
MNWCPNSARVLLVGLHPRRNLWRSVIYECRSFLCLFFASLCLYSCLCLLCFRFTLRSFFSLLRLRFALFREWCPASCFTSTLALHAESDSSE